MPLSDPQEQAGLASQHALLGEQQRNQMGNLSAAYNIGSQGPQPGYGDFLTNIANQQMGQRTALDSAHLFAAMQARRDAVTQASQVASGAGAMATAPRQDLTADFPSLFGALAQAAAFRKSSLPPGGANTQGVGMGAGERPIGSYNGAPANGPIDPNNMWSQIGASGQLGNYSGGGGLSPVVIPRG